MVSFVTRAVIGGLSLFALAQASPVYDSLTPHRKVNIPTPHVRQYAKHHVKRRFDNSTGGGLNSTGGGLNSDLQRDLQTLKVFATTITQDPEGLVANWTAESPDVCSFDGVFCEADPAGNNALAEISFPNYYIGNDLSLSGFLDKLYDVALFHINSNYFTGTVPDLSALPYLYELDLSNNQLSGEFPLTTLVPDLTFLDLRFNSFSGPLPADLFNNKEYIAIFVNENQFDGPLPDFKGSTNDVHYINVANNSFTGPIPDSWANNAGLKQVLFSNNSLEGTIPDDFCALPFLSRVDVGGNADLVGPLGPNCQALYKSGILTGISETGIQV